MRRPQGEPHIGPSAQPRVVRWLAKCQAVSLLTLWMIYTATRDLAAAAAVRRREAMVSFRQVPPVFDSLHLGMVILDLGIRAALPPHATVFLPRSRALSPEVVS